MLPSNEHKDDKKGATESFSGLDRSDQLQHSLKPKPDPE